MSNIKLIINENILIVGQNEYEIFNTKLREKKAILSPDQTTNLSKKKKKRCSGHKPSQNCTFKINPRLPDEERRFSKMSDL